MAQLSPSQYHFQARRTRRSMDSDRTLHQLPSQKYEDDYQAGYDGYGQPYPDPPELEGPVPSNEPLLGRSSVLTLLPSLTATSRTTPTGVLARFRFLGRYFFLPCALIPISLWLVFSAPSLFFDSRFSLSSESSNAHERNPSYLVSGSNGAVASEEARCSRIGVEVLKDNGTATDAAISTALCIGVVNSFSSGIGGGGFMVIKPAPCRLKVGCKPQVPISIDFRETATAGSYYSERFQKDPILSQVGGLSIGVPGELAGFEAAYSRFGGGVSWQRIFAPSIALAKNFSVGQTLAQRLYKDGPSESARWMLAKPEWRAVFFPPGRPRPRTGDYIQRPAYARTLETIARDGVGGFYNGTIAAQLVETISRAGGRIDATDFARYKARVAPALKTSYQGRTVWTTDAPSSGPMLLYVLNMLEKYGLPHVPRTALAEHRFVEALKYAFAGRTELGDPAFLNATQRARIAQIRSKAFGEQTHAQIDDARTYGYRHYKPHYDLNNEHGTTHVSVIDSAGSAVSLTSTVNLLFGSQEMDVSTGIILNDENDDFSVPGRSNYFDLFSSALNYPERSKRPASSISPIVVEGPRGEPWCALGASGGSRIFGAVVGTLLKLDWGYDISHAIEDPRIHHQLLPNQVSVETSYRSDFLNGLKQRGHQVKSVDIFYGQSAVHGVIRNPKNGILFAASDSRKNGVADAY